jgi:hypothetical protein
MLALILIYFVGKAFYDLAGVHGKGQWLYAILGVGSYYGSQFVAGIFIAIGYELFIGSVEEINDVVLSIVALPIGILACWGFYRLLKSRWEKKETFSGSAEEVLDANLIDPNSEKL